jgi:hypothetical protein
MYEPSPDCFVAAPFHPEKGFFVPCNYLIKGNIMKMLMSILLVRSPDPGKKPEALEFRWI